MDSTSYQPCDCAPVEISPVNIAPAIQNPQVAALLTPQPVAKHTQPKDIFIYVTETKPLTTNSDSDLVEFVITFNVNISTPSENTGEVDIGSAVSTNYTVNKHVSVSKTRLANDAVDAISAIVPTVIENVVSSAKKTDVQRARELAGIPHNKNYVLNNK